MIDYDQLLDDLDHWATVQPRAAEAIWHLLAERERYQWVPCSERLPDERVPVLVWHSQLGFGGENFVVDGEFEGRPAPTHWMPMPDPPAEQGGE